MTTLAFAPKENLFRADFRPDVQLRAAADDGQPDAAPVMVGHFCVFNRWTEIDSWYEGNFLERIAPGSCKKTFRENRASMRVLFQHGRDFQIGDKPLGPIDDLREDELGGYYEVPLLDAPYVREDILPGLEAGLYGASFRFRVMREEWVEEPGVSDYNPKGLPERTLKEISISEFGPVTFPAYAEATAGLRSVTDHFITVDRLRADPERARALVEAIDRAGADHVITAMHPSDTTTLRAIAAAVAGIDPQASRPPAERDERDATGEQDNAPDPGTADPPQSEGERDTQHTAPAPGDRPTPKAAEDIYPFNRTGRKPGWYLP